ncbi:MAG: MFS transporter [Roseiflexaceae bacterium]|nr:MFS transporter [Roseiflexus sp.]MDW8214694.1 MFS transporter [Roseiflexaceae bacterium]
MLSRKLDEECIVVSSPVVVPPPHRRLRVPHALRALRHRNYRLLFFGQLIAHIGFWMQATAQGWLVLRLTDAPFWLGAIAAAQSLPVLILSAPAGALADRVSKRTLLLMTQGTAMAMALLLALLIFSDTVRVWHVLIAALMVGIASAFENPARQAFTVELVGRDDLINAIALDSTVMNGARIIGPAVAGALVAATGEGPAFLFNGLSVLAVIGGLLMMRLHPFVAPPRRSNWQQMREGFAYMRHNAQVRLLLLQITAHCVFGLAYFPLMPYFARNVLGADAQGFGILASTNAAGALMAALMITFVGDRLPRFGVRSAALLSYMLLLGAFTLTRSFVLAMALLAAIGWAGITVLTLTNTLLQMAAPDDMRGRVMGVYMLVVMGVSQVSGLFLSSMADVLGDVPLVVGCWALVGWVVQAYLFVLWRRALHDAAQVAPLPRV